MIKQIYTLTLLDPDLGDASLCLTTFFCLTPLLHYKQSNAQF
ncbi:hypothetical protein [Acinetobacter bereziniae]|nr:hypothetical protein [Acinetobacter bereziniae]